VLGVARPPAQEHDDGEGRHAEHLPYSPSWNSGKAHPGVLDEVSSDEFRLRLRQIKGTRFTSAVAATRKVTAARIPNGAPSRPIGGGNVNKNHPPCWILGLDDAHRRERPGHHRRPDDNPAREEARN